MTSEAEPKAIEFFNELETALQDDIFIELLLTKYRGRDSDLKRVIVRRVLLKTAPHLSFVFRYQTRDETKNTSIAEGIKRIRSWLGDEFKDAHLFTTNQDLQIGFSKRGKVTLGRSTPSKSAESNSAHNRSKQRMIDPSRPYLRDLGITHANSQIVPAMARKWKQINRFIEIFGHAIESATLTQQKTIRVVDFGSGKGYLTFAMHDHLATQLQAKPDVVGVELREHLVTFCKGIAQQHSLHGLSFRLGDVRSSPPEPMDALIALHACDTATDLALHLGIRSEARVIMCSPCCHKEIRKQIQVPELLQPVLKYGVHLGQEADMVTDAIRALLLEANGYEVQILEFVSLEHTSKNKMILAVHNGSRKPNAQALDQVQQLKTTYGIQRQMLETLLSSSEASAAAVYPNPIAPNSPS